MSKFLMCRARMVLPVLLIAFSQTAFGLGLGNIKVESFLNQPLNARIDLLVRPGEDISGITAQMASAEDYALIGASRNAISVPLRFVVNTEGEQAYVQVSSNLPVHDPVVRLIIELNWASGRLLREYTLFLDPPAVPAQAPPPLIDQRRQTVESAQPEDPEISQAVPEQAQPEVVQEAVEPAVSGRDTSSSSPGEAAYAGGEYGPVQSGDTLWRIASNWSENSGASVNQLMLAIQRNNPQAFINNNINLLKRGAILRMPSAEDVAAISAAVAREEVLEQIAQFNGAQSVPPIPQKVAPAVETPLVDVASEMSSASPADEPDAGLAQLEIVPPSEDSMADSAYGAEDSAERSSASTSIVSLQEELARKEEALITEQQTNEYLQQRIRELEAQAAGTAPIELENEELAEMESRLREQRQAAELAVAVPVVQSASTSAAKPWYSRWIVWIIVALILVSALVGWFRSRRGGEIPELKRSADIDNKDPVRGIKDEAEEILKVLKPTDPGSKAEDLKDPQSGSVPSPDSERDADSEEPSSEDPSIKSARLSSSAKTYDQEDAYVLDEDSADLEVRLDLARAYISMGDREAARAILGEVIEHGDEAQQSEAKSMLSGL